MLCSNWIELELLGMRIKEFGIKNYQEGMGNKSTIGIWT